MDYTNLEFEGYSGEKGDTAKQLLKFYLAFLGPDEMVDVHMPGQYWGKEFVDHIGKENILEVIEHKWLGSSSICLYLRYLCETYLRQPNAESKFTFISPHEQGESCTFEEHIRNIITQYAGQDHLLLAPCNVGHHWVLVGINTSEQKIFFMDPVRRLFSERPLMRKIFDDAIINYRKKKLGVLIGRREILEPSWTTIKCPKQNNNTDCGYYVYLYIRDILESQRTIIMNYGTKLKQNINFPPTRIEKFKNEWCAYLYYKFLSKKLTK